MDVQRASTKELTGLRVVDGRDGKRIGKVRRFVFHPTQRRVIGFSVKRPDAALMFHRKDLFVSLAGYSLEEGQVVVLDKPAATGKDALRALGVDWDSCIIWVGMPILTESGDSLGFVGEVSFDRRTGRVESISAEGDAASKVILGMRTIPGKLVKGFRQGRGSGLALLDGHRAEEASGSDESALGAIIVADAAAELGQDGGAAAAAGKATAVVADKAKQGAGKARVVVGSRVEAAKPTVRKVAKHTGAAVESGVYAAGKQLGKASGMFAAFKEEFDKAAFGEDGERPDIEQDNASEGKDDA